MKRAEENPKYGTRRNRNRKEWIQNAHNSTKRTNKFNVSIFLFVRFMYHYALVAFPFRCVIAIFLGCKTATTERRREKGNRLVKRKLRYNVWQAKYVYVSLLFDFGCGKLLWVRCVSWLNIEHLGILSMQPIDVVIIWCPIWFDCCHYNTFFFALLLPISFSTLCVTLSLLVNSSFHFFIT